MNLIIDIGNSYAKLVAFDKEQIVAEKCTSNQTLEDLIPFSQSLPFRRGIISTVIDLSVTAKEQLKKCQIPLLTLNHLTPIPIVNKYHTPQTLGTDRLAAVIGAQQMFPNRNLLVIDAGTAITYEFIDAKGNYWGGNISPGLNMRLKALHAFTNKLPLVESIGDLPEIGFDTFTAIRSGVIKGLKLEIEGYIRDLSNKYPDLFVFLTGGDKINFDTKIKSSIFADKYIVPRGLNRILEYNDKQ